MEKLRIQKMPYINQGTANIKLRSVKEFHAIFKFDTDKEAEDFIRKVNKWYYGDPEGIERLANFIITIIEGEPSKSEGAIDCAIRLLKNYHDEAKGINKPDLHSEETKEKITESLVNAAKKRNKDEIKLYLEDKDEVKTKEPVPKKRKAGRPPKTDIQG